MIDTAFGMIKVTVMIAATTIDNYNKARLMFYDNESS